MGAFFYLGGYIALSASWSSLPAVVTVVSLMSVGMIFVNVSNNKMLMSSVAKEHYSISGALAKMSRTMSLPIGIAVLNFTLNSFYRAGADPSAGNLTGTRFGNLSCSDSNATTSAPCIEDMDAYMMAATYSTLLMLVPCLLLLALAFCRLRVPKATTTQNTKTDAGNDCASADDTPNASTNGDSHHLHLRALSLSHTHSPHSIADPVKFTVTANATEQSIASPKEIPKPADPDRENGDQPHLRIGTEMTAQSQLPKIMADKDSEDKLAAAVQTCNRNSPSSAVPDVSSHV